MFKIFVFWLKKLLEQVEIELSLSEGDQLHVKVVLKELVLVDRVIDIMPGA